jgi:hypothetical protein
MRTIKGYVVVCETDDRLFLFGEVLSTRRSDRENLENNGLVPFSTLAEVSFVAAHFFDGRKDSVGEVANVGRIHLEIVENEGDLDALRRKRNRSFVVIFNYRGEVVTLLGMYGATTRRIFDSGGYMGEKAKPFQDLEDALHLAREAARQGQSPAAVAFYCLRVLARTRRNRRQIRRKR